jgi:AGZA family xanthine/uracil permease-like MFS transporter
VGNDQANRQEEKALALKALALVARYFKFAERGTNIFTEARAGLTTFMVMAYIIAVNASIISVADFKTHELIGPEKLPTIVMTCLVAGIMTLAMGLLANYPFALAAGMGINAVVAYDLIAGRHMAWQDAMAVIAWEGIIITILVLTGLRGAIMRAIPMSLKRSIGVGIGLFILFIGLQEGGFVVQGATLVTRGQMTTAPVLVFIVGLALALVLTVRKVKGALLISIIVSTVLAIVLNQWLGADKAGFLPGTAVVPSYWITQFDNQTFSTLGAPLSHMLTIWTTPALPIITLSLVVFSLMLSDFFDTMGTVIGVGEEAGLLDDEGNLPGINRVLLVDSVAAIAGGLGSTSSNTTYIESAAGVSEGGRTGFTAVIVGLLFLACIFLAPVVAVIPAAATAPALVIVGYLMFTIVREIEWGEMDDLFPAMLTMIVMPLTYSITNGIAVGFVAFVFLKVLHGKAREVHPLMWLVSAAFVLYFASDYIQILVK